MIELQSVGKQYLIGERRVAALQAVDLRIDAGEYVAVTGRSGSGKSTLLNLMACLDRPDSGSLFIGGCEVGSAHSQLRAQIRNEQLGFVFQQFNLLPQLSAIDNVALPLQYASPSPADPHELARAALKDVGLIDWSHHRPAQLSGGQQQRVAIARALVRHPPLILADEPTGALDSGTAEEVLALLEAVGRTGVTLLLVTHDPVVARRARRRIHMSDGQIVSDSSA